MAEGLNMIDKLLIERLQEIMTPGEIEISRNTKGFMLIEYAAAYGFPLILRRLNDGIECWTAPDPEWMRLC